MFDDDEPVPDEKSDAERELAPSVEGPAIDVPDESAASPELRRRFWWLVVVFNLALGALSVGAMLVAFTDQWTVGAQLLLAGAVLSGYGIYKYRAATHGGLETADADGSGADPLDDSRKD